MADNLKNLDERIKEATRRLLDETSLNVSLVIDIEAPVNEIFQFNAQAWAQTTPRKDEELLPLRKFTKNPVSTIYDPYKIRPKAIKYKEREHPFKGWRMVNGSRHFSSDRHLVHRDGWQCCILACHRMLISIVHMVIYLIYVTLVGVILDDI